MRGLVVERHKLKCDLKVGERMIIIWQHLFIYKQQNDL